MKGWAFNVIAAWSQFWNAFWGGDRDQSFSSRCWEARLLNKRWGFAAVWMIDRTFWFQPDHCRRAFYSDFERTYGGDAER